ncbi:peptide transporter [Bifidobacterium margollesii]|uniref:Peptide transporter n=1 Tax=Bifidobacterium margollesii TaxID=2020964 RepID=A0A2N5J5U8_9BIFI|nr:ParA family protein [Bifidobacterium margollesii]PLS29591.1 peptide transporter [Bifidobacterium margollesii]
MRIALANAKGGVAKTTSAIYLASAAARRGLKARVLDADPQSSASLWRDMAAESGEPLDFAVEPANMSTLKRPDRMGDGWEFVDAPPSGPVLARAIGCADMVIVPASDSPLDLQQAWSTMGTIPDSIPAAVLIVRAETNTRAFDLVRGALDEQRTPRFDTVVRKRQDVKMGLNRRPGKLWEYAEAFDELKRFLTGPMDGSGSGE